MPGAVALKRAAIALGEFIASGAFPVTVLAILLLWSAAMAGLVLWPETFTPAANLAASFRIWCFGYDPGTGKYDMA